MKNIKKGEIMIKKAFLIASPQKEGSSDYLPGVTPDIHNMKKFLISDKGGAWNDSEIEILENPTRIDILSRIKGEFEYVIIQYSGHGFEFTDKGPQLFLSKNEYIGLEEIHHNFTCPRRFYFIDCCRGIEHTYQESMDSYNFANIFEGSNNNRKIIRSRYENIIKSCEEGCSVIFSCSRNESANEDDNGLGGIFTLSYLRTANLANPAYNNYCSIKSIFDAAVVRMRKDYPFSLQNPNMIPERKLRNFPFVINTEVRNV